MNMLSKAERGRIRAREWRLKYPERFKQAKKECYLKRRKYYLNKAKEYRLKHKQSRKEYDKKRMNELPHRKILLDAKIPIECKLCGAKENINKIQMSIHHVDGNHNNNILSNLVWVCESCHQYLHNPNGVNSEMVIINGYGKKEDR